ncbi:unnamed protein product [Symbiodinium pilosum]|uniref:Uncharacterized protein n=1 Tax=Symbiodinium pilosum TaxID=2952 RepID=A0A812REB4_SYMPI|nr:unnamed protein product [Symbiodinium pilosum]
MDDYEYDPNVADEPLDTAAQAVSSWLKDEVVVPRKKDGWQTSFCMCVQNSNIASWYQYASSMYVVDTCSHEDGFVLRTGHMQDRHVQPLQGMMACDTLKVVSYCLSHEAPEALPMWKPLCDHAHYTIPSCDVACNSAVRVAGSLGALALGRSTSASLASGN